MKVNTFMPKRLKPYFEQELKSYQIECLRGNLKKAWRHLERAHILGQKYPYAHSLVHFKMLQFGLMIKNWKEVLGQLPRLFFGGVKSFVGKIPLGNPGGSNVPPLESFPIDKELLEMFNKAKVSI